MFKHPKSLRVFFATEMWERYGFYVVQSLLALYLALYFKWPDSKVYMLVGSFTALTYLSPLIGGYIADQLIGQKRAILLGAALLSISYWVLSVTTEMSMITVALSGVALGTGLLKPNISSLLGNEYPPDSERRFSGFTIFYMGISLGIILGTTLPSLLQETLGWGAAFSSGALGLIFSFLVFLSGAYFYKIQDYSPFVFSFKKVAITSILLVFLGLLSFFVLNSPKIASIIFGLVIVVSALYIIFSIKNEPKKQALQTLVIGLLCIISAFFWSFYFQMFLSLTLFIARIVEPTWLGIQFPAPYYVTVQSIGLIIFGYFLARRSVQMSLIERGINTGKKFITAMMLMCLAYFLIFLACKITPLDHFISPMYIIPSYLLIALAELYLSPVGLAAITLLADKSKISTMVGIMFVSLGVGGFLSPELANLSAIPSGETDFIVLKSLYTHAFKQQFYILLLATSVCFVLYHVIRRLLLQSQSH